MIKKISKYFLDIIKGGVNLLFPPLCFNCNQILQDNEKVVCENCWSSISKMTEEILSKKAKGDFVDNIDALWLFDDIFQNIVHNLKYSNCQSIGLRIGKEMGLYLSGKNQIEIEKALIVPVPLHPIKKRERGYNQSEIIAKTISAITGIEMKTHLVKRVKNTATQTKMNKEERKKNMHKAFRVTENIKHKLIIIIDDVYTTGTTINSVAEAIKQNNKNIEVWAFAAAMPES